MTLGWRGALFVTTNTDTDSYLIILPVLDSSPGVFLNFILGFSLNFLPAEISIRVRRQGVAVSRLALLVLLQWQLYLDDIYWTDHWILFVWPPLIAIAIAIAALVYFFRRHRWSGSGRGGHRWYGWATSVLVFICGTLR